MAHWQQMWETAGNYQFLFLLIDFVLSCGL